MAKLRRMILQEVLLLLVFHRELLYKALARVRSRIYFSTLTLSFFGFGFLAGFSSPCNTDFEKAAAAFPSRTSATAARSALLEALAEAQLRVPTTFFVPS